MKKLKSPGFTLIELLVVIGILAILLAIVLIAVNPARQFSQARDTQRWSDVNAILNAVHQYYADNGSLPTGITETPTNIADDGIDICDELVGTGQTYLAAMPYDPNAAGAHYTSCSDYDTGYNISTANNRVTVAAPSAEVESSISVTR
jgi:prepilin-type N-terminal cleavage/methylation domain-containing protein